MIFIKLTISKEADWNRGDPVYVNPLHISSIQRDTKDTWILMNSEKRVHRVEETPEEIFKIIEESKLDKILEPLGIRGLL
jgi:uncharacterized protein YlzI (FlbEa/FlbD family)